MTVRTCSFPLYDLLMILQFFSGQIIIRSVLFCVSPPGYYSTIFDDLDLTRRVGLSLFITPSSFLFPSLVVSISFPSTLPFSLYTQCSIRDQTLTLLFYCAPSFHPHLPLIFLASKHPPPQSYVFPTPFPRCQFRFSATMHTLLVHFVHRTTLPRQCHLVSFPLRFVM